MGDIVALLKEDWQNIPANIRYIFYAGVFLIVVAWVGDHWSDQQQYHLPFPFVNNENAFHWGITFISFVFVLLLLKQIMVYRRIWWLRRKYPLTEFERRFHLVNLQGWIYLIDERSKERLHVKNPQTVRDLGLYPNWYNIEIPKDASPNTELTLRNGKTITLGDYPENSAGIHTQGISSV